MDGLGGTVWNRGEILVSIQSKYKMSYWHMWKTNNKSPAILWPKTDQQF